MKQSSQRSQRGSAAPIVALVLLVGMTLIVFFANRTLVFEQRTSANQYRSTKALAAAEAGVEWAIANFNAPMNLGTSCTAAGGTKTFRENYLNPAAASPPAYGTTTGSFSTTQPACSRQSGGGWACSCPVGTTATPPTVGAPTCDDASGACPKFVVTFERVQDPALGTTCASSATNCVPSAIKITSTGYTDSSGTPDGTATISQMFKTLPALASPPGAPLTAKGTVSMSGNLNVTNTDPSTNGLTINAGGGVTLGGSSSVTTLSGTPPAASIAGNDSALGALTDDEMFKTFFGMSKTEFQNSSMTKQITCTTCGNSELGAAIAAGANIIWVNGDLHLNANGTYGTATNPVIIVATGNIQVNGTVDITGLMYSQAATWDNSGGGNATICGAAIAEGDFTGQGTPNPTYCPNVFQILKNSAGSFGKIPGSWRDF